TVEEEEFPAQGGSREAQSPKDMPDVMLAVPERALAILPGLSPMNGREPHEDEWSLWPEFGLDPGNPPELSKGYVAATFLSSSPTCPARQSGLRVSSFGRRDDHGRTRGYQR